MTEVSEKVTERLSLLAGIFLLVVVGVVALEDVVLGNIISSGHLSLLTRCSPGKSTIRSILAILNFAFLEEYKYLLGVALKMRLCEEFIWLVMQRYLLQ